MVEQLQNSLSNLDFRQHSYEYVDITDDFLKISSKIEYGTIAKSKAFKLLQGTHALETLNPKLDTSLLEIAEFDVCSLKSIDQLNWLLSRLYGCLCAWLDNSALSVTTKNLLTFTLYYKIAKTMKMMLWKL
ncbi:unnamed protein product [Ambrosiozyma monospora]|uniref:Unnamed protein product n=1 Tax=Ambrosiozyma monospora TaxID=43982 RepID=A0A9W6YYI5_AMBMO|nr:unnamed protein product [Ambrosiozyma monospora]